MNIILGITGSVATILTPKVVKSLKELGHQVKIVRTYYSQFFWWDYTLDLFKDVKLYDDGDEFEHFYKKGDPVLHIELREWADVLIIAPLSANTLSKMSRGIADNLLTSLVLAWRRDHPIIIAPAMNTVMWTNPLTEENLKKVISVYKCKVAYPQSKVLACGEEGDGAMAQISDILKLL